MIEAQAAVIVDYLGRVFWVLVAYLVVSMVDMFRWGSKD